MWTAQKRRGHPEQATKISHSGQLHLQPPPAQSVKAFSLGSFGRLPLFFTFQQISHHFLQLFRYLIQIYLSGVAFCQGRDHRILSYCVTTISHLLPKESLGAIPVGWALMAASWEALLD